MPPFRVLMRSLALILVALGAGLMALHAHARQAPDGPVVRVAAIEGVIGPAKTRYIASAIDGAQGEAAAVVLTMNTPGGLDQAMREINAAILASEVPVIVYVSPEGARATSAGAYILYASHLAAMAPGTSVGAATPVQMGGGFDDAPEDERPVPEDAPEDDAGSGAEDGENGETAEADAEEDAEAPRGSPLPAPGNTQAMRNKAVNDAVAYIRSLAELRDRNGDWAERAVREGVSLTYSGALEQDVIDIVATDLQDLFAQASGQTVTVRGAGEIELDLADAIIERVEMGFADEFLSVITDPNIALLLMNLGFIGILVSFYQGLEPVTLIAGLICLIIGLYALNTLPLNYAGAALIMLGLGLLIAEIFFASYGLLALGGLIAFAVGALMLVDSDVEGLRIDWWMVAGATGVLGVAVFAAASYGLAAQGRKVTTGKESLLGDTGRVLSWADGHGHVHVQGERWQAVSQSPLAPGDTVSVTAVDGLVLTVTPKPEEPPHA